MNEIDLQNKFIKLVKTMHALRAPGGCQWDKAQTHQTLIKHLREESEEAIAAINNNDDDNLQEELGDVLLQVLFHAAIAQEQGRFDIGGVIDGLTQKLIRRHPHVFGTAHAATPEQALAQWKAIKVQEKILKQNIQEGKKC